LLRFNSIFDYCFRSFIRLLVDLFDISSNWFERLIDWYFFEKSQRDIYVLILKITTSFVSNCFFLTQTIFLSENFWTDFRLWLNMFFFKLVDYSSRQLTSKTNDHVFVFETIICILILILFFFNSLVLFEKLI
jgi:hypothetical protein